MPKNTGHRVEPAESRRAPSEIVDAFSSVIDGLVRLARLQGIPANDLAEAFVAAVLSHYRTRPPRMGRARR